MRVWSVLVALALTAVFRSGVADAEVFAVPENIAELARAFDEVHELRSPTGEHLGEQRSRAKVEGDKLAVECTSHFTNGEVWDERATMDITNGYRARSFRKVVRGPKGDVVNEENVDFATGDVRWLAAGKRSEQKFQLPPDTYMGPMLGVVLAGVPNAQGGTATFSTLVFRPDPAVYTLRADVVAQEVYREGKLAEPTTKMRLKADLGPVQNTVFASMIPTHYFWFTRDTPPTFFAFEGSLGNGGAELRMIPQDGSPRTAMAR